MRVGGACGCFAGVWLGSKVTDAQTTMAGNAVELQPLLRPGQFSCGGENSLVITPSGGGPNVTWTFERSS